MEKLIVSMMRFSTAITLLGMEQLEQAMTVRDGEDLSQTTERFRATLDAFTDTLSKELNHKKQTTLKSVTRMSEEAVHQAVKTMNVADPRELLRSTTDLMKKTSDSVADLVSKGADTFGETFGENKPAAATVAATKRKAKHHR